MKRILFIIFMIFLAVTNYGAFGRPKKVKCEKPIYFFENVDKAKYFDYLDQITQKSKLSVGKFYPELGFMVINYNKEEVALDLKQYGSDLYLFINISKGNTSLEKLLYAELKKHSSNSYLMKDNMFCQQFTKDVEMINTRRKPFLQDGERKPGVYVISMKRYVGYDKKTYFAETLKEKFKKKPKVKKQTTEKL